jgi:hypothetical protein
MFLKNRNENILPFPYFQFTLHYAFGNGLLIEQIIENSKLNCKRSLFTL